jgi:hypothetical protein
VCVWCVCACVCVCVCVCDIYDQACFSPQGSELFHFRVSVVPGVTFCNLVEEFQVL